eukprot:Clim_evm26s153 gene=Clim_evmTU26s153
MEAVIEKITQTGSSPAQVEILHRYLKLEDTRATLAKNATQVDNALSSIDQGDNSLGFMFLLKVKAEMPEIPEPDNFVQQVRDFVAACDPQQVLQDVPIFVDVVRRAVDLQLVQEGLKDYTQIISMIVVAVNKLRTRHSVIVPLHADLVKICILGKFYVVAVEYINQDMLDFDVDTGITALDILLYFYYGGIVYTVLQRWQDAINFFDMALSMPANELSQVMIEAYKKKIILNLLVHGRGPSLPEHVSSIVLRFINQEQLVGPYRKYAKAFLAYDVSTVQTLTEAQEFKDDNNYGIVKRCTQMLHRRLIQRLTKTFITLSLDEVARKAALPTGADAERHIVQMIEQGEINARIDQVKGVVFFKDDMGPDDSAMIMQELTGRIENVIKLNKRLEMITHSIATSEVFIRKKMILEPSTTTVNSDEIMSNAGQEGGTEDTSLRRS